MLPYAIQSFAATVTRAAKQHPAMAIGLGSVGVLLIATLLKRRVTGLLLPAGGLPGGPLPVGTTSLTSYLGNDFFTGVRDLGAYFRSRGSSIKDEDLIAVFMAESGVHASVPNRQNGVCLGLNQICPKFAASHDPERVSGLRAVGFQGSLADYSRLSEAQQLKFVRGYFDNVNQYPAIRNYGSLYLANFNPGHMGKPDNFVLYRRGDSAYGPNASVDFGNKGFIEVADMARFVERSVNANRAKWNELRMRLQQAGGGPLIAGALQDNPFPFTCAPMAGGGFALRKNAVGGSGWAPAAGACPYCRAAAGCVCSKTCSGGMTG